MDNIVMVSPGEQMLVDSALARPAAFADIYDRYAPRVYTYIRYRVDDRQAADDLTAQTFEQALLSLGSYHAEQAPLGAWLFGIAHNVVSRHYRAQSRHRWLSLDTILNREVAEYAGGLPSEGQPVTIGGLSGVLVDGLEGEAHIVDDTNFQDGKSRLSLGDIGGGIVWNSNPEALFPDSIAYSNGRLLHG